MHYGANPIEDYYKRHYYRFTDEAYQVFMNWYDELKKINSIKKTDDIDEVE